MITREEYEFMEAVGENTGNAWGLVDVDGRLHKCPLSPFFLSPYSDADCMPISCYHL